MAFVVTDSCVKCKHTDCVAVCPVDCFYEGNNMLVIHPDECIDCGACERECPVSAIYEEADVPAGQRVYVAINAVLSGHMYYNEVDTSAWPKPLVEWAKVNRGGWPQLTDQRDPLPTAEQAATQTNKLGSIDPNPGAGS